MIQPTLFPAARDFFLRPADAPPGRTDRATSARADAPALPAAGGSTRVLIADDHHLVRLGFVQLVSRQPDMRVVAEASNGQQAVRAFVEHRPEVVLMDLRMPGLAGVDAIRAIRQHCSRVAIVVLTAFGGDLDHASAFGLSVQARVTKDQPSDELLATIRRVRGNGVPVRVDRPSPAGVAPATGPKGGEGVATQGLRRVFNYLRVNLAEKVSVRQLARTAGLSSHHFARCFKASTGLTPHSYLMHCRLERAKSLLRGSDLSLAEVSAEAGFANQSHFTTFFRKSTGITPGRYRELA